MQVSVSKAAPKKTPTFFRVPTGQTITIKVDADDEFYYRESDHKVYGVIAGANTPLVLNGGLRHSNRWSVASMRAASDQA